MDPHLRRLLAGLTDPSLAGAGPWGLGGPAPTQPDSGAPAAHDPGFEDPGFEDLGFARLDHHRPHRQGLPEVVYGGGKTAAQLVAIVARLVARARPVLLTRLDPALREACGADLDGGVYDPLSRTWLWRPQDQPAPDPAERVAVVCAGTSDLPVAEEAARTAEAFGLAVDRLADVGVAGIHRLVEALPRLRAARVAIVVAGMEGALPSVAGGLLACPIIAVPTSVGYGASFGGVAALLAMLNSCASGVTVVNIDNGFGAACAALRIVRGAAARRDAGGPSAGGAAEPPP